ncbi:MAG: GHKL domain-containing protein, partial [Halobacteria archaeon]|nr:GHKL domain-containing protein [Halobacteria archaeon]
MMYSSRRIIIAGFGLVLLLLLFMMATGLRNMSMINESVSDIAHVRNVKIDLVSKMRNIARERSLSLYHMVMSRDAFVTDDEKIKMSFLAGQFIAARDQLLSFQMESEEKQMIDTALELAYSSTRIQRQVIGFMEMEQYSVARSMLVEDAIPAQNRLLTQYDAVLDLQQKLAKQTANAAEATYETSYITMLLIGVVLTTIAMVIAIFVAMRTTNIEQKLYKLNTDLEKRVEDRTSELLRLNKELETFSYAVSHDLRAPVRSMIGFSQALREDCAGKINADEMDYLNRIYDSGIHMSELIDALLNLSRHTQAGLNKQHGSISDLVKTIAAEIQSRYPDKKVHFEIQESLKAWFDEGMLRAALTNLLDNAVKFSRFKATPTIEFGCIKSQHNSNIFYVRDNGVGFDMQYADRLFGAFQRMHSKAEYEGSGIGLATVARIVHRHQGEIWADAEVGKGATFYFTLAIQKKEKNSITFT